MTTATLNPHQINREEMISLLNQSARDRKVRKYLAKNSFLYFFSEYFKHYTFLPPATFHETILRCAEDNSIESQVITAFRGSGKSTILNLALPIWNIVGKFQLKSIFLAARTQEQGRQHLKNIKDELERNQKLKDDFGPFRMDDQEWRSLALTLPKYDAKIWAVSVDQSVRGFRNREYRPQLIVADDLEDSASVVSRDSRDRIEQWVTEDLLGTGDPGTRFIMIGTPLHEDSVLSRMARRMKDSSLPGARRNVALAFPVVDRHGNSAWPGKFPDQSALDAERMRLGRDSAWQREFLLLTVTDERRVIKREWIQYYDKLPDFKDESLPFRYAAIGVDLAATLGSGDYTAMVAALVFGWEPNMKIYILPDPINERMIAPDIIDKAKILAESLVPGNRAKLFIEDAGIQKMVIQHLEREGYLAEGFKVAGTNKESRLALTSRFVYNGKILFPKKGTEKLIDQVVNFGIERNDDLADAYSVLINSIIMGKNKKMAIPEVFSAGFSNLDD